MASRGRRIAARRNQLGMYQSDLAEKMGVSRQSVSAWERDEISDLRGRNLAKLAEILQTTAEWLAFGIQDDAPPPPSDDDITEKISAIISRMTPLERSELLQYLCEREEESRRIYEELRKKFEQP